MDVSDPITEPFAKKAKANLYRSITIVDFFYEKDPEADNKWICKNCKASKVCNIKVSYSNLRSHCQTCYGLDYENMITEHLAATKQRVGYDGKITRTLLSGPKAFVRYTDRQRDCYRWLRVIIMNNLPLSCCDNENMRDLAGCNIDGSRRHSFSAKTMRKYILALTLLVEMAISKKLREKLLCLMFDGWEHRRRKYVGLFAGYEEDETFPSHYEEVLLAIQPTMQVDENGTADAHVDLIESTLEIYDIDAEEQLVCLGADKYVGPFFSLFNPAHKSHFPSLSQHQH